MASIVLFTTITIVVPSSLICERRSFLFNSIKAQKADPQHFNNDKEESNRNLDKNKGQPGGHVIARSPLYWSLKSYKKHFEDVRAAQNQMHKLQNKLLTNNVIPIKIFNQLHPKQNVHLKSSEHKQEKIKVVQAESPVRKKREVVIHPQTQPEMVMQPNIQPALLQQAEARDNRPSLLFHFFNPSIYYPEVVDALSNNSGHYQDKIIEKKRDKRQILLMIKQRRPIVLTKKARTTPNPFIPETNNADYDIMKPDIYRPEVDIDNTDSYQLSPIQKVFSDITKMLMNLKIWLNRQDENPILQLKTNVRLKRSPKMSKLYKKQKLAKKKRKKKKQQKLTPRQIKHYRRIREKKEKRRRILHKKLKEKRRLRHKKMGTGPYNKSIIDYYGVYFDSSSSILNDSLYDSIYDTEAIDSDQLYEGQMKNYPDSEEDSDGEEEDYTFEGSTEEDEANSTVNYYDPPSTKINDSLYDSIYDTEAVDSDRMYEDHMKHHSDSEEESEETNSNGNTGSGDSSKGGGHKRESHINKVSEGGNCFKDNSEKLSSKNMYTDKKLTKQESRTNQKPINKKELPSNNVNQNKNSLSAINDDNTKKKCVMKKFKSQSPPIPNGYYLPKSESDHINNLSQTRTRPISIKFQPEIHSRSKNIPTFDVLDVIFEKTRYGKLCEGINYKKNIHCHSNDNALFGPILLHGPIKSNSNGPGNVYENIIPVMKSSSIFKRVPI